MRLSLLRASAGLLLALAVPARAEEKERTLCDPADPKNRCPGAECLCTENTLEVTFDGMTESNLVVDATKVGTKIRVTIMSDTRDSRVQGWAYGVAHDEEILRIDWATTNGTDVKSDPRNELENARIHNIMTCTDPSDPKCVEAKDGGGWISAVVLALTAELPVRRNSLALAEYTLLREPGPEGTLIRFTDRLKRRGSPPVQYNMTINGKVTIPTTVVDGFITGAGTPSARLLRGDADGNGRSNVADAILIIQNAAGVLAPRIDCEDALDADDDGRLTPEDGVRLLQHLFGAASSLPDPSRACGEDPTVDSLGCLVSNCQGDPDPGRL